MTTEEEKEANREFPFRFRPAVLLAAACFCGTLFAYFQYILKAYFLFSAVIAAVSIFLIFVFRKKKYLVAALVLLVAVNASAAYAFSRNTPAPLGGKFEISGKVFSVGRYGFVLSDVTIEGYPVDLRVGVTAKRDEGLEEGDLVRFIGKCTSLDASDDEESLGYVAAGVGYLAEAGEIQKLKSEPDLFGKMRLRLKRSLNLTLGKDDAGLAASLLLGDKAELSEFDREMASASGTAHIFAVSGLHVGFLVGALLWLLKKLRANRRVSVLVIAAVLLTYGFLTGFPKSFNRAAIMSLIFLFSGVAGRRYDLLSSLAASAVVILLFDPLALFTVSFQMSFASLFGIALLYRPFYRVLKRALRLKGFSASIAMSLSATLGVYPVTVAYFGTFSTYFIFSNLLVIPLVAAAYLLLAAASIPAVIAPEAFSFLFYAAYGFLRAVAAITAFFGSLPASQIAARPLGLGSAGYYACAAFSSDQCLYRGGKRALSIAISVISAIALFALSAAISAA